MNLHDCQQMIINHLDLRNISYNHIIGYILFGASILFGNFGSICHPPVLIVSNADNSNPCYSRLQRILAQVPSLYKIFYPPLLFSNGHLQLVPFTLQCWWRMKFPLVNFITEFVTLPDGEKIVLDWVDVLPTPQNHANGKDSNECRIDVPIVIIHHGANCDSRDLPGQTYISEARRRGWYVCVFNRRGHNKALTRPNFNFFGSTDDLRAVLSGHLEQRYPYSRLFMVGMSAGSGLIASYMGQQGRATTYDNRMNIYDSTECVGKDANHKQQAPEPQTQQPKRVPGYVTAAVGVSPGYNVEQAMRPSRLVQPFNRMLLDSTNRNFVIPNKHLFGPDIDSKYCYDELINAPDMQAWLDHSYACAGFTSKEEYYNATNPMRFVEYISEPCIFINARDDPFCHINNLHDDQHVFDRGAHGCCVAVTETGSHCSFLEMGMMSNWTERVTFEFFDAVLKDLEESHESFSNISTTTEKHV